MVRLDRSRARGAVPGLLAITTLAGCSVIFDADDFVREQGPPVPDARPVDETMLRLTSIDPSTVDEGMGAVRPIPIVLKGMNIAQGATVAIISDVDLGLTWGALQVASDGSMAAFELTIPVLPMLGDGNSATVLVRIQQGDIMGEQVLTVAGLDELVASEYLTMRPDNTLDTADLGDGKFSRIDIDRSLTVVSSNEAITPLRLEATAAVELSAPLRAEGQQPAPGQGGGAPGQGGCRGGDPGQAGSCSPGGGAAATGPPNGGGGGGGGHADMGEPGQGMMSGAGGAITGAVELVPLESERGHGGGGGSGGGAGGGGGGGGVLELTSLGTFHVGQGALVSVQGGAGGHCAGGGGGGGGGSGGAILMRAASSFEEQVTGAILLLDGGPGGSQECDSSGGAGAPGRARVDAASTPAFALATPGAHRGPVLDPQTPVVSRDKELSLTVLGGPSQQYFVASGDTAPTSLMTDGDGRGTGIVMLKEGLNTVCALATGSRQPDSESCLDVAYLLP